MPDRIPIGTVPGLTSQLDDVDILIATLGVAATVTRVLLRQTDYDDGGATDTSVTGSIRNATAGGGDGIAFVIPDQGQSVVATGSMEVSASESIYLRVSAGNLISQNLTGWIEVSGAAGVTTALTTLARVKAFLGITASTDDDLITQLIAGVSDEVQTWLGRQILQATATGEKIDSIGDVKINTRHYPIIAVSSLSENGTALVEDTDFEVTEQDLAAGQVARISGDDAMGWTKGLRVVEITYSHGYATVPEGIAQFATELVAFDYLQTYAGGKRIGTRGVSPQAGGSGDFETRSDFWQARRTRIAPYQRKAF